jgi:hypothetical protein
MCLHDKVQSVSVSQRQGTRIFGHPVPQFVKLRLIDSVGADNPYRFGLGIDLVVWIELYLVESEEHWFRRVAFCNRLEGISNPFLSGLAPGIAR